MRISDWSSDVCSSDLGRDRESSHGWMLLTDRLTPVGSSRGGLKPFLWVWRSRYRLTMSSMMLPDLVEKYHLPQKRWRSEEHTSELQSLMRTSYDVCCLKKKKKKTLTT